MRVRGSAEQRGYSGVQTRTALSVSRLGKSAAAWAGLIVVYLEVSLELVYWKHTTDCGLSVCMALLVAGTEHTVPLLGSWSFPGWQCRRGDSNANWAPEDFKENARVKVLAVVFLMCKI